MELLVLLFAQAALWMSTFGQELPGTFEFGSVNPTFQEIRGLPKHQQGFIISHPSFQQTNTGSLNQKQQVQVKAQEDFRRAVAEANRKRINGGEFRASQELPFTEIEGENPQQFESTKHISIPNSGILGQRLPFQDETVETRTSTRLFDSKKNSESSFLLPVQEGRNFDDESLTGQQLEAKKFREQAENAKYSFKTAVSDSVNDNSHIRQESRDGLKLKGLYSYSDGYFKRTVHYVADEQGYRVVKEESEPIGSGPQINPSGKVDVSTQVGGSNLQYTIRGENLPPPIPVKHQRN